MTERQLRRIINEEINNILNEGIGDIKRAQRAGNKNFVDPLVAKQQARVPINQAQLKKLALKYFIENNTKLDDAYLKALRTSGYNTKINELNKLADSLDNLIKKHGLQKDVSVRKEIIEMIEDETSLVYGDHLCFSPEDLRNYTNSETWAVTFSNHSDGYRGRDSNYGPMAGAILDYENELYFQKDPLNGFEAEPLSIYFDFNDAIGLFSELADYDEMGHFAVGDDMSFDEMKKCIDGYIDSLCEDIESSVYNISMSLGEVKPVLNKLIKMYK